jgi:hypothetical protein
MTRKLHDIASKEQPAFINLSQIIHVTDLKQVA